MSTKLKWFKAAVPNLFFARVPLGRKKENSRTLL